MGHHHRRLVSSVPPPLLPPTSTVAPAIFGLSSLFTPYHILGLVDPDPTSIIHGSDHYSELITVAADYPPLSLKAPLHLVSRSPSAPKL
ncbi:hypothetical protein ACH5RR_008249 [Cinchona calisaya]|uniref:Uncharacterized protein n=1 Tax=Cinchona calisaya TaxID=153742 RepID=A0ABD3AB47_9GENT